MANVVARENAIRKFFSLPLEEYLSASLSDVCSKDVASKEPGQSNDAKEFRDVSADGFLLSLNAATGEASPEHWHAVALQCFHEHDNISEACETVFEVFGEYMGGDTDIDYDLPDSRQLPGAVFESHLDVVIEFIASIFSFLNREQKKEGLGEFPVYHSTASFSSANYPTTTRTGNFTSLDEIPSMGCHCELRDSHLAFSRYISVKSSVQDVKPPLRSPTTFLSYIGPCPHPTLLLVYLGLQFPSLIIHALLRLCVTVSGANNLSFLGNSASLFSLSPETLSPSPVFLTIYKILDILSYQYFKHIAIALKHISLSLSHSTLQILSGEASKPYLENFVNSSFLLLRTLSFSPFCYASAIDEIFSIISTKVVLNIYFIVSQNDIIASKNSGRVDYMNTMLSHLILCEMERLTSVSLNVVMLLLSLSQNDHGGKTKSLSSRCEKILDDLCLAFNNCSNRTLMSNFKNYYNNSSRTSTSSSLNNSKGPLDVDTSPKTPSLSSSPYSSSSFIQSLVRSIPKVSSLLLYYPASIGKKKNGDGHVCKGGCKRIVSQHVQLILQTLGIIGGEEAAITILKNLLTVSNPPSHKSFSFSNTKLSSEHTKDFGAAFIELCEVFSALYGRSCVSESLVSALSEFPLSTLMGLMRNTTNSTNLVNNSVTSDNTRSPQNSTEMKPSVSTTTTPAHSALYQSVLHILSMAKLLISWSNGLLWDDNIGKEISLSPSMKKFINWLLELFVPPHFPHQLMYTVKEEIDSVSNPIFILPFILSPDSFDEIGETIFSVFGTLFHKCVALHHSGGTLEDVKEDNMEYRGSKRDRDCDNVIGKERDGDVAMKDDIDSEEDYRKNCGRNPHYHLPVWLVCEWTSHLLGYFVVLLRQRSSLSQFCAKYNSLSTEQDGELAYENDSAFNNYSAKNNTPVCIEKESNRAYGSSDWSQEICEMVSDFIFTQECAEMAYLTPLQRPINNFRLQMESPSTSLFPLTISQWKWFNGSSSKLYYSEVVNPQCGIGDLGNLHEMNRENIVKLISALLFPYPPVFSKLSSSIFGVSPSVVSFLDALLQRIETLNALPPLNQYSSVLPIKPVTKVHRHYEVLFSQFPVLYDIILLLGERGCYLSRSSTAVVLKESDLYKSLHRHEESVSSICGILMVLLSLAIGNWHSVSLNGRTSLIEKTATTHSADGPVNTLREKSEEGNAMGIEQGGSNVEQVQEIEPSALWSFKVTTHLPTSPSVVHLYPSLYASTVKLLRILSCVPGWLPSPLNDCQDLIQWLSPTQIVDFLYESLFSFLVVFPISSKRRKISKTEADPYILPLKWMMIQNLGQLDHYYMRLFGQKNHKEG